MQGITDTTVRYAEQEIRVQQQCNLKAGGT